jgi:hypothetical protein
VGAQPLLVGPRTWVSETPVVGRAGAAAIGVVAPVGFQPIDLTTLWRCGDFGLWGVGGGPLDPFFPNPDKNVIFLGYNPSRRFHHTSPVEGPLYRDPSLSLPVRLGFPIRPPGLIVRIVRVEAPGFASMNP